MSPIVYTSEATGGVFQACDQSPWRQRIWMYKVPNLLSFSFIAFLSLSTPTFTGKKVPTCTYNTTATALSFALFNEVFNKYTYVNKVLLLKRVSTVIYVYIYIYIYNKEQHLFKIEIFSNCIHTVCMYVCMYVYIYIYIYIYIHTCIHSKLKVIKEKKNINKYWILELSIYQSTPPPPKKKTFHKNIKQHNCFQHW